MRRTHPTVSANLRRKLPLIARRAVIIVRRYSYPANEDTRLDHHERIRRHLGFVRCGPAERRRLLDHMVATARAVPRAATLYPLACRWLLEQRIVRPGPSTMRDILARAREQALAATFEVLTAGLTAEQRDQLDQLLLPPEAQDGSPASARSRLDGFRAPAPGVSAAALVMLTEHLGELHGLGFARWPALGSVHPATRRLLAGWGYAYDAWSLRRFEPAKRHAVLICTLEAALAEATDALVEMQDKLITRVHNRARKHRADLLHATDAAKARAVSVLEDLGGLVLDEDGVPDAELRARIYERHSREEIGLLVDGCRGCARVTRARTWASLGAGMRLRASTRRPCWRPLRCASRRAPSWAAPSSTYAPSTARGGASSATRRWTSCPRAGAAMSCPRPRGPRPSGRSRGRTTRWRCCPRSTSASRAAT